ncbi:nuclear transport factor 2 family protein [Salinimonas chungwhensis]|uniref:nuclear transport factor 2 family protein n=1 Tax=Salinimonas chungwhensis TaxID=265425 RepID=UPI000477A78C|nr:nuclear transport factor 2 family protein [Salinimonas chungwhensis]
MTHIERFCSIYRDLTKISSTDLQTIYTQDVEFIDPIQRHKGIDDVAHYFEKLNEQASSCEFDIQHVVTCESNDADIHYLITWYMTLVLKKPQKTIHLDGTTLLKKTDQGFYFHRDYYDLGEMVYEHIPLIGWIIKKVKRKLAQ